MSIVCIYTLLCASLWWWTTTIN